MTRLIRISVVFCFLMAVTVVSFAQFKGKITGKVLNNSGYTEITLVNIMAQTDITKSQIAKDGAFSMEFDIPKSDFFRLNFSEDESVLLVLAPAENVDVTIDMNELTKPVVKGSVNTSLLYTKLDENKNFDKQIDDYKTKIENDKKQMVRNLVNQSPNSLVCLLFIDVLSIDEDLDTYKKLVDGLKEYTENPLVADLKGKVESANFLAPGTMAPEIDLPNQDGKNIKLSSLRGKYVLIDFWASWCKPCRMESPNMVKLYNQYKSKGFEIYSVSLDKEKESWTEAIKKDGLGSWTHVSDLLYWDSKAGGDYKIESIPFTVLIDKEGKVIAKGLRGKDLEDKIAATIK